jgi:hypothetical protein
MAEAQTQIAQESTRPNIRTGLRVLIASFALNGAALATSSGEAGADCWVEIDENGNNIVKCDNVVATTSPPVYTPPSGNPGVPETTVKPRPKPTTTTINPDSDMDTYLLETEDPEAKDFNDGSPGIGEPGVEIAANYGINVDPTTEEGARNIQIARTVAEKDWPLIVESFAAYGLTVMNPTTTTTTELVTTTTQAVTTTEAVSTSTSLLAESTTTQSTAASTSTSETKEVIVIPIDDDISSGEGNSNLFAIGGGIIGAGGVLFFLVRRRHHDDHTKPSGIAANI